MRSRSVVALIVLGLALAGASTSIASGAVLAPLASPEIVGYVSSDSGVTVAVKN